MIPESSFKSDERGQPTLRGCTPLKTCSRCKEEKSATEFNKDSGRKDGLRSQCKSCRSVSYKTCEQKYPGRLAAQRKWYYKNHKEEIAKQHKEHIQANKEKIAKRQKEYRQTPAGKAAQQKEAARRRRKFPEKIKAGHVVDNAVRYGQLVRPTICSSCLREKFVEGHHPDYSKPFEVEWLCKKCHVEVHHKVLTGAGR